MAKKVISKLSTIAAKAVGKRCILCSQYISESEASDSDFIYNELSGKRGDSFVHKHCFDDEYGKKG